MSEDDIDVERSQLVKIAVAIVLQERGYTAREAECVWRGRWNRMSFKPVTKREILDDVKSAASSIDLMRDMGRVGTSAYEGLAYFWAYKYRFWMRGDAHGNGYNGLSIEKARRLIHAKFLEENLALDGETARHDEIINGVFNKHAMPPNINCDYDEEGEDK